MWRRVAIRSSNLSYYRAHAQLTQKELADLAGVSRKTIGRIETASCKSESDPEIFDAIDRALRSRLGDPTITISRGVSRIVGYLHFENDEYRKGLQAIIHEIKRSPVSPGMSRSRLELDLTFIYDPKTPGPAVGHRPFYCWAGSVEHARKKKTPILPRDRRDLSIQLIDTGGQIALVDCVPHEFDRHRLVFSYVQEHGIEIYKLLRKKQDIVDRQNEIKRIRQQLVDESKTLRDGYDEVISEIEKYAIRRGRDIGGLPS